MKIISSLSTQHLRSRSAVFVLLFLISVLTAVGGCRQGNGQANQLPPINTSASWWDSDKQEVRIVPSSSLPNTEDQLAERNGLPNTPTKSVSSSSSSSSGSTQTSSQSFDMSLLFLIIGVIVLMAIIVVVAFSLRQPIVELRRHQFDNRVELESAKIAELPFEVEVSDEGFLATAKRHAREGRYDNAIVYLFSHVLVDLDHRKLITLRRGKTNRMLVRELRPYAKINKEFQSLVVAFERVFFGRHNLTAAEFEQCMKCCDAIDAEHRATENPKSVANAQSVSIAAIGLSIVLFVGCDRIPGEKYGVSQEDERESLAGLNVLQELFSQSGRRTVEVDRLSPRLQRFGTIVWAPDTFSPPTPEQCAWIDNWLSNNPQAIFIYVGRDYMPGSDYWQLASESVPENMRLPYLKQAARSSADEDNDIINRGVQTPELSRWFIRQPSLLARTREEVFSQTEIDQSLSCELTRRALLVPITDSSEQDLQANFGKELRSQVESDIAVIVEQLKEKETQGWKDEIDFRPPSSYDTSEDASTIRELAEKDFQDLKEAEKLKQPPNTLHSPIPLTPAPQVVDSEREKKLDSIAANRLAELEMQPLYRSTDGTPLIYEILDPSWGDSRLIVVNNASLCCNYALADADRRRVTMSIIERSREDSRAAFLSVPNPVLRYASPPSNDPFGLALFTIYPLNIILIHCLLLGIVALIVMWPIFGRPQAIPERNTTDFGRHIEAFGQLLRKTRDRTYALQMVGRYHREIKKDNSSEWSMVDRPQIPKDNRTSSD